MRDDPQEMRRQMMSKWSSQNFGKYPDPWYKLRFKPPPEKKKNQTSGSEMFKFVSFLFNFKRVGFQNIEYDE